MIGLKKAYFPLIRLPSCYRTVCYWIVCYWTVCYRTVQKANHIQRCSLKQPITFKVVITCACACFCVFAFLFCFCILCELSPFFTTWPFFSEIVIFMINWFCFCFVFLLFCFAFVFYANFPLFLQLGHFSRKL